MSRFNSEAYDKLFPRSADPDPIPESVVDTFRPSQDKLEDPVPKAKVETVLPEMDPLAGDPEPEGGVEDGHAEHSEPDSE